MSTISNFFSYSNPMPSFPVNPQTVQTIHGGNYDMEYIAGEQDYNYAPIGTVVSERSYGTVLGYFTKINYRDWIDQNGNKLNPHTMMTGRTVEQWGNGLVSNAILALVSEDPEIRALAQAIAAKTSEPINPFR